MKIKRTYKVRALVLDKKERVYAIQAKSPHVLQLPGGSRKAKENPIAAIKREILEETGFKVKILSESATLTVNREDGTEEITTCYVTQVVGKGRKPRYTKRERNRGLAVHRYPDVDAFTEALSERVSRYGRTAARRDYQLATAAAQSI